MEYSVSPGESVVERLARATDRCDSCDACRYEPVHAVVDGDALNALFDSSVRQPRRQDVDQRVSIDTADCTVTVYDGEYITVRPRPDTEGRSATAPGDG